MEQGYLHGQTDSKLSKRGKLEALSAAEWLRGKHFDIMYSSPLGRARETSDILASTIHPQPVILEGLRERSFGVFEGKKSPFMQKLLLVSILQPLRLFFFMFIGENYLKFSRRVNKTLDGILLQDSDISVLVVSHNGVIAVMLSKLLGEDSIFDALRYQSTPCGISEIEIDMKGRVKLIILNHSAHIHFSDS
jgi:probable phosphoglycerate mutase